VRELGNWVDCDLPLAGKTLAIAVHGVERNLIDRESCERSLRVPIGYHLRL
jgi:hypothetical protein